MILTIILTLVVIFNMGFLFFLVRDLWQNKNALKEEKGNTMIMAISQFFIYLLSTFGISDFAIGASFYPKMKWVEDKKLPGTLNTACVLPVAVMALIYISSIKVELTTLLVAIIAQVVGSYISPGIVVKLPARIIKIFVALGLLIAAGLIIAGKYGYLTSGGEATGLVGYKLILLGILSFIYGAFNNIGIGSYALTMATVYALGLNSSVTFPIMMGACTFSVAVGGTQFIRLKQYSRKITFFSATFGVLGVFIAAFTVKSLETKNLQWIVAAVIIYSALTMLFSIRKSKKLTGK